MSCTESWQEKVGPEEPVRRLLPGTSRLAETRLSGRPGVGGPSDLAADCFAGAFLASVEDTHALGDRTGFHRSRHELPQRWLPDADSHEPGSPVHRSRA